MTVTLKKISKDLHYLFQKMKESGFEDCLVYGSSALFLQGYPLPWVPNDVDLVALIYEKTSFGQLYGTLLKDGYVTDIHPSTEPHRVNDLEYIAFKIDELKYELMTKPPDGKSDFSLRTTVQLNDLTLNVRTLEGVIQDSEIRLNGMKKGPHYKEEEIWEYEKRLELLKKLSR